nr:hypothetical protein [Mycobacterium sp.]
MTSATVTWSASAGTSSFSSLVDAVAQFVPISVMDVRYRAASGEFVSILPLDDIVFADICWSSRDLARKNSRAVPVNGEYHALAAVRAGSETVGIGGESHRLTTGDLVLWDCQAPTLFSVPSRLRKSALLIPTLVLEHMSLKPRAGRGLEFFNDAPTAPLLRQLLAYLSDHQQPLSTAYRRTRNALLELALGTIESARDISSTSLVPALRVAVCRWIDEHILDEDLSPRTIAAAHAVSVRTLHRAFQIRVTHCRRNGDGTKDGTGPRSTRGRTQCDDGVDDVELRQPQPFLSNVRCEVPDEPDRVQATRPRRILYRCGCHVCVSGPPGLPHS